MSLTKIHEAAWFLSGLCPEGWGSPAARRIERQILAACKKSKDGLEAVYHLYRCPGTEPTALYVRLVEVLWRYGERPR